MTDVLKATYSDLKTVKTRSVCQLILELPIEALTEVVALLGAPVPGNEVWVAVARLRQGGTEPASEPVMVASEPELLPPHKRATWAQIAGIICNEPAFWRYIDVPNAEEAAEYVRSRCGISTRAALDSNPDAAMMFRTLRADYQIWMAGLAA